MQPPRAIPVSIHDLKQEFKPSDTQYYLNEFNTVYQEVGLSHNALTPPQSPPNQQPLLANLQPLLVQLPFIPQENKSHFDVPEKQLLLHETCGSLPITMDIVQFNTFSEPLVPTYQPEMDQSFNPGLAVEELEELVRTTAEDMQWSSSSNHSSSPGSPGASSSSNFGDCSSDDPEWIPETVDESLKDTLGKSPRKRRAYTKGAPEDKKVRKKEQNKNAATRYRMKKKAEIEEILSEERELIKHHDQLETKILDMQREIKYLKGLMRDLFKAKGLIN